MVFYRFAKGICFGVLILLTALLQTKILTRVPVMPNPMVSVPAVVTLSVFAGPVAGAADGQLPLSFRPFEIKTVRIKV